MRGRDHDIRSRFAARVRRPLRRFARDKRGVSAVEFAMLLPLMITLYLGGVEVSQAIAIDRKVTLIARTLADLVAQSTSVNTDRHDQHPQRRDGGRGALSATRQAEGHGVERRDRRTGVAKVIWSETKNGTARAVGSTVTLPAALNVANTSLIWAEATYAYTPTIGYVITGTMTLKDQIYMRPRLSDT